MKKRKRQKKKIVPSFYNQNSLQTTKTKFTFAKWSETQTLILKSHDASEGRIRGGQRKQKKYKKKARISRKKSEILKSLIDSGLRMLHFLYRMYLTPLSDHQTRQVHEHLDEFNMNIHHEHSLRSVIHSVISEYLCTIKTLLSLIQKKKKIKVLKT